MRYCFVPLVTRHAFLNDGINLMCFCKKNYSFRTIIQEVRQLRTRIFVSPKTGFEHFLMLWYPRIHNIIEQLQFWINPVTCQNIYYGLTGRVDENLFAPLLQFAKLWCNSGNAYVLNLELVPYMPVPASAPNQMSLIRQCTISINLSPRWGVSLTSWSVCSDFKRPLIIDFWVLDYAHYFVVSKTGFAC